MLKIIKNKHMKKLFPLLSILFLSISIQAQEVTWISFEKAVELNKENPKPLLVDVYTDWCGWCKKMDKETYTNKTIIDYINTHFYAVKLDGEDKNDIVYNDYTFKFKANGRRGYNEFAAALLNGKLSYPTTVFLDAKMQLLDRVPGYLDTKMMEQITAFFATESYKNVEWETFQKEFKSSL